MIILEARLKFHPRSMFCQLTGGLSPAIGLPPTRGPGTSYKFS